LLYKLFVYAWDGVAATGSALHESAWITGPASRDYHTRVDYEAFGGLTLTASQQYVAFLSAVDTAGLRHPSYAGDAGLLLGATTTASDAYSAGYAVTKPSPRAAEGTRAGVAFADVADAASPRAWVRLPVDLAFEMAFA
jgi:hypothetical protein